MLDRPKIKNKKSLKKARAKSARQAGWQQAKASAYDLIHGTVKRDLEAGAKAAKEGKPGMDFPNFATAAIRQAVQEVPTNIKNVGKMFSGVLKGIFNHPSWYAYKGNLSIPAHNIMRPFTPKSIKAITPDWSTLSNKKTATGFGVTHMIQVAIGFNDVMNSESFQLAAIEAFKAIRLDLRSNLPYEQANYNNFVLMACSIYVKAKAIEKALGLYNYTRPDIPEYTRASQTVPYNINEKGVLTPTLIKMLDNDNYARTLNDFKKLKSIMQNIAIPRKLAEYLSWWVGSQFIDQAAPNPQIYTTVLRRAVVYNAPDINTLNIAGSWDIADGSVQDVIDEALNLLNVFGLMNADIIKTGRYGMCDVVLPEAYTPTFLNDPEFFSILVNAYGFDRNDPELAEFISKEYIRVDALEELSDVNLVGMANALSKWSGFVTLCTIESMACYLDVDDSFELPCQAGAVLTGGAYANNGTTEANGAWLQVNGKEYASLVSKVTNSTTTVNVTVNADNRLPSGVTPTAVTCNVSNFSAQTRTYQQAIDLITTSRAGNEYILRVTKGDKFQLVINGTATDLTYSGTITHSGSEIIVTAGTLTLTTAQADYFIKDDAGWGFTATRNIVFVISYATSTNPEVAFVGSDTNLTAVFCELVDYHMPMLLKTFVSSYLNGTRVGTIANVPSMLKECYKPMLFNYADISVVLYWMYLGLFSME